MKKQEWKNRIIGYDEVDADQLLANPLNHRIHPLSQQKGLSATLGSVGWVQNIIVNKRTGHVIDGHLRTELSISKGEKVPVAYVDLSEEEERTILATFDPIGAMAAEDREKLDDLLKSIQSDDEQVMKLLEEIREENGIIEPPVITEDEAPIDKAEELQKKWQVTRGQVWEVPSLTVKGKCHRVMCGDSTDAGDVALLMAGEKASICVTSPPYYNQRPEYKIFESYAVYNDFLKSILKQTESVAGFPFVLCWNTGDNQADCLPMIAHQTCEIEKAGFIYLDTIIWVKSGAGYSIPRSAHIRSHQYFYPALRWEPIIVFRIGDTMPKFDKKDVEEVSSWHQNVWEISQVIGSAQDKEGHPAMYPTELPYRCMKSYSAAGMVCFDPFLGSGTTLIAAEQTGRICYGMEIAEKYVSVILERCLNNGLEPRVSE